jgi:hypothetical protein
MQALEALLVANVDVQLACPGIDDLPAVIDQSFDGSR